MSDDLPRYEHTEIVTALQIRAMELRDGGERLILHFYEDHPPQIVPMRVIRGVPALHSFMVTDDFGAVKFVPEIEFRVSYRRGNFT